MVTKRKPNKKGSTDAPAVRVGASQPASPEPAGVVPSAITPTDKPAPKAKQTPKISAKTSGKPAANSVGKSTPKPAPKSRPSVKPAAKAKAKTVAAAQAFVKVKDAEQEEVASSVVAPSIKESAKPTVKSKAAKPKPARRPIEVPDAASQDGDEASDLSTLDRVKTGFAQKYRMATGAYGDDPSKNDGSSPGSDITNSGSNFLGKDADEQANSGADEENSADEASADAPPRKSAKSAKKRHWLRWVLLALLAIVVVVVSVFSWDRWLRYDDAREFAGEWQVGGTARTIVVDGTSIKLTDDVAYTYQLDPTAKTITFSFGNMSGTGRYRFSADRTQLLVDDSGSHTVLSTLFDDIAWMWDATLRSVQGKEQIEFLAAEGLLALNRVSHDGAALPRDIAIDAPAQPEAAAPESEPTAGEPAVDSPTAEGSEGSDPAGNTESPADFVASDESGAASALSSQSLFNVNDVSG